MKAVTDASGLYEVERRAYHAARPGFRIAELQISPKQKVPWHYHNNVHDTFYVVSGAIRIFLQQPKEEVRLTPGQTYAEAPAPRDQCGRHVRRVSRAARHRRIRFRPPDVNPPSDASGHVRQRALSFSEWRDAWAGVVNWGRPLCAGRGAQPAPSRHFS